MRNKLASLVIGLGSSIVHTLRLRDTYVLSFPKSGRTWLRMLLATYFSQHYNVKVTPEITEQGRQNPRVPIIRFTHLGAETPSLDCDLGRLKNKRVIFLIRDPRDVVVSYYYEVTRRASVWPDHVSSIHSFVRDGCFGIPRIVEFMNLVMRNRQRIPRLRIISYEELQRDTAAKLGELLAFTGVRGVQEEVVRLCVKSCSFENMRGMEAKGLIAHDSMRPGDASDPQSYKVREGRVGGHRGYLLADDLDYVNAYIRRNLDSVYGVYGYLSAAEKEM